MRIFQIPIIVIVIIQFASATQGPGGGGNVGGGGGNVGGSLPGPKTPPPPSTTTIKPTTITTSTVQPSTEKSTIPTQKPPKNPENPKKSEKVCAKDCSGHGYCQFNQRAHLYECICDLWTTGQNCQIEIPLTPIFVHLFLGLLTFVFIMFIYYWTSRKKPKMIIYNENMAFSWFLFENKKVGKVDHEEFKNQTMAIEKEKEIAKNQENDEKYVHDDDLGSTINTVRQDTTRQDSTKTKF